MKHRLVDMIDQATVVDLAAKEAPFRNHLGGSIIGRKCDREIWYTFRWAKRPSFNGRMLRLFARGHREEFLFISYLTRVGIAVEDRDPSTGKQWRIVDVDGHFGGSLDGIATQVPDLPADEPVLLEFKTHNTKSFVNLVAEGVEKAKPEHHKQMQIYMHKRGLKHALYFAVNKNDDDLHIELVDYDPSIGPELIERARNIIRSAKPPNRIAKHPSWFECKFCDYQRICHFGEPMDKSCRSCSNSEPAKDGRWRCKLWDALIPSDVIPIGCDSYKTITD
jgi:hypothetical protein